MKFLVGVATDTFTFTTLRRKFAHVKYALDAYRKCLLAYLFFFLHVTCANFFQVPAHMDDINAVAWADKESNIFISGSDDGLVKVWDKRCLLSSESSACVSKSEDNKCVGLLSGHTQVSLNIM